MATAAAAKPRGRKSATARPKAAAAPKAAQDGRPTKTPTKAQAEKLMAVFRSGEPTAANVKQAREAYGITPIVPKAKVKAIRPASRSSITHGALTSNAEQTVCGIATKAWAGGIEKSDTEVNCLWCLARIK